jgi:hypothetical protein
MMSVHPALGHAIAGISRRQADLAVAVERARSIQTLLG